MNLVTQTYDPGATSALILPNGFADGSDSNESFSDTAEITRLEHAGIDTSSMTNEEGKCPP